MALVNGVEESLLYRLYGIRIGKKTLVVGGTICAVVGLVYSIPSVLVGNIAFATVFSLVMVLGLILLAIGLGD
ncbi:MAG TPA: hypothetical protein VJI46_06395 [Candidatus Nanoarchaeia archaeon]|nr:hypothetical protein [Candidatus Nanoarchaeia archaeon]